MTRNAFTGRQADGKTVRQTGIFTNSSSAEKGFVRILKFPE
jgi:hypothetical protein